MVLSGTTCLLQHLNFKAQKNRFLDTKYRCLASYCISVAWCTIYACVTRAIGLFTHNSVAGCVATSLVIASVVLRPNWTPDTSVLQNVVIISAYVLINFAASVWVKGFDCRCIVDELSANLYANVGVAVQDTIIVKVAQSDLSGQLAPLPDGATTCVHAICSFFTLCGTERP